MVNGVVFQVLALLACVACQEVTTSTAQPHNVSYAYHHKCTSGDIILNDLLCDGVPHCWDGSDEEGCPTHHETQCARDKYPCGSSSGQCISFNLVCDGFADCLDGRDEWQCVWPPCYSDTICQGINDVATCRLMRIDKCLKSFDNHVLRPFTDAGLTLLPSKLRCDPAVPPSMTSRKAEKFTLSQLCDGEATCKDQNDEPMICDVGEVCAGKFRCRGHAICIDMQKICDGSVDCPRGDDEKFCEIKSNLDDADCEFTGLRANCTSRKLKSLYFNQRISIRYLDVSANSLSELPMLGKDLPYLKWVSASRNYIRSIVGSFHRALNLEFLDLSFNQMVTMDRISVQDLVSLREVDLRGNNLALHFLYDQNIFGNVATRIHLDRAFNVCCTFEHSVRLGCDEVQRDRLSSCGRVLKFSDVLSCIWIVSIIGIVTSLHQLFDSSVSSKWLSEKFRSIFWINIPLCGMLSTAFSFSQGILARMEPSLSSDELGTWMASRACLYYASFGLLTFCVSVLLAAIHAVYSIVSPFYRQLEITIVQNKKLVILFHFLYTLLIFIIPTSVILPYVFMPKRLGHFQESMDEICSPISILLKSELSGGSEAYLLSIFFGGTSLVCLVIFVCFIFAVIVSRRRANERITDEDIDGITEEMDRTSGRAIIFSWTSITLVLVDFVIAASLLAIGILAWGKWVTISMHVNVTICSILIPAMTIIKTAVYSVKAINRKLRDHASYKRSLRVRKVIGFREGSLFRRTPSRKTSRLTTFTKRGEKLTPFEVLGLAHSMMSSLKDLHSEGMVCDEITADQVLLRIDGQGYIKRAELITNIEVPKWDVHQWREQRDVRMAGEIVNWTMKHLESMGYRGQDMQTRSVMFHLRDSSVMELRSEIM